MPARKPPPPHEKPQFERFLEAAREVEAAETDEGLDKVVRKVLPPRKERPNKEFFHESFPQKRQVIGTRLAHPNIYLDHKPNFVLGGIWLCKQPLGLYAAPRNQAVVLKEAVDRLLNRRDICHLPFVGNRKPIKESFKPIIYIPALKDETPRLLLPHEKYL